MGNEARLNDGQVMTWHAHDHSTRPELLEPVSSLMQLVIKLNRNDFAIFAIYSGHVAKLHVQLYPAGWSMSENCQQ
jgi:hypothetical protein